MSFLLTNPSPYILNLPAMTNVANSATGGTSAAFMNSLSNAFNSATNSINTNGLSAFSGSNISVTNTLALSNVGVSFNGSNLLTSNVLNGRNYLAFQVSGVEGARLTGVGLGVGLTAPAAPLDVGGNAVVRGTLGVGVLSPIAPLDVEGRGVVRGNLYISTMGAAVTPLIGNLIADGDIYANGNFYPSDPVLKQDIRPYAVDRLPEAVEFTWKATGLRDVGVLATDVYGIEPTCVKTGASGHLNVDYAKLVVLCLAECKSLRSRVTELERECAALRLGSPPGRA